MMTSRITTRHRFPSRLFATMMFSMAVAGFASEYYSPRAIGVVAGLLVVATALAWA